MELVNIKKEEFEEFGEVSEISGGGSTKKPQPAEVSQKAKTAGAGDATK
jgi:hypothetical protein